MWIFRFAFHISYYVWMSLSPLLSIKYRFGCASKIVLIRRFLITIRFFLRQYMVFLFIIIIIKSCCEYIVLWHSHPFSLYPLPPFFSLSIPIHHCPWKILYTASSVCTELMYLSFSWSINTGVSIRRSPQGNVIFEYILTSIVVPCMSCSSYFKWFGRWDISGPIVGWCFQVVTKIAQGILM